VTGTNKRWLASFEAAVKTASRQFFALANCGQLNVLTAARFAPLQVSPVKVGVVVRGILQVGPLPLATSEGMSLPMGIAQIHGQQLPRSAWLAEFESFFSGAKPTHVVRRLDGLNHPASPALIAALTKQTGVQGSPP
jgi:hypothetical protein